ncbi:hypothetical protein SAMN05519103_04166 [Rhizobiales bacterium GAS113]|nr:hypothetical protein SAMN05519103_04166 [Rhizobiales bacterium GAS113]
MDRSRIPSTSQSWKRFTCGRFSVSGLRVMGLAMGLISAGHAVGAAAGAFLGGYLFDISLRYDWVWTSSVVLSGLAGFIVSLLGVRRAPLPAAA